MIWWDVCRAASNADTSDALTGFPILPEDCTWRWEGQVHWRIFDDAKKTAPWWSDALTNFRWCQKSCTLMIECIDGFSILSEGCTWLWDSQMHWRIWRWCQKCYILMIECTGEFSINFAVSVTDAVARFLTVWWRRQAGGQTGGSGRRQTDKARRQMRRCLLTFKASKLIREKWWKAMIQSWNFLGTCWIETVNKQLIVKFLGNVPEVWKKKSITMIRSWRF